MRIISNKSITKEDVLKIWKTIHDKTWDVDNYELHDNYVEKRWEIIRKTNSYKKLNGKVPGELDSYLSYFSKEDLVLVYLNFLELYKTLK